VGFASHYTWLDWNCVTATINTNRNPETNHNIHLLSLTLPTHDRLLSAVWEVNTHGVPRPTVIGHFGASSYTGWPKKWGDCLIGHIIKRRKPMCNTFNIFQHCFISEYRHWGHMTDSEQLRCSCDSNNEQIALSFAICRHFRL